MEKLTERLPGSKILDPVPRKQYLV